MDEKGVGKLMWRMKHIAVVLAASIGLSACGAMQTEIFDESFWSNSPTKENTSAELGLAELAKGNYVGAEGLFQKALKINPQDIHALLGLGMIYQNNGQITSARQMYEAILALRPSQNEQFVVWKNLATRPVSEIASVNLALIDSGGVLTSMGRETGVQPESVMARPEIMQPLSGAMTGQAMTARMVPVPAESMETGIARFAEANINIVSRFKTMIALRDQGLLTREEFNVRRQANVGALLPLTSPPPASGLDRPVPSTEQISGRLRAIGRGLEMRAITVAEHTAERSMILDALMPAAPVSVANPGMPPQGLLEAADGVRWLEHLQQAQLITADEYARERGAIEQAMQPPAPKLAPVAMVSSSPAEQNASTATSSGPQPGVHLASYRSMREAERGWSQLRRAYKAELEGLQPDISKVDLGTKGVFYRLKAGPLVDKGAAQAMCSKLKSKRQFCEPTFVNAG